MATAAPVPALEPCLGKLLEVLRPLKANAEYNAQLVACSEELLCE
jgi:hypothetical protein